MKSNLIVLGIGVSHIVGLFLLFGMLYTNEVFTFISLIVGIGYWLLSTILFFSQLDLYIKNIEQQKTIRKLSRKREKDEQ